jgi:polysaccharide chain length determinant protein (PEP-CTERM system associated)
MNGLYDELMVALHSVWKRRWLALAVGWGIALLGWLVISLIPNKYESTAKLLVQASTLLPDKVGITASDRQQGVDAVRQTLTSAVNLEKVVRGTDLVLQVASDRDVTERAVALSKSVKVVAEQDNLFKISAESGDSSLSDAANAKLSRQIVQKIIDLFVDGSLSGSRLETGQTIKFLDAQLDARAKQLSDAEAKALLPGAGTIADRISAARSEMARIDGELGAAQASLAAVRGQMASTPASTRTAGGMIGGTAGGPDPSAGIRAQIAQGRARGWTDQHPDMVSLREELSRTPSGSGGGTAARQGPAIVTANPMYMSLRSMLAEKQAVATALSARKGQIQGQINAVLAQQAANPEVSAEQTRLERNYQVLKTQYDKLLADRDDVRLRGDVQSQTASAKFSVIDPPSSPKSPATPNRPLLLTLVLLTAIGGGTGAAFAMGQLQGSYATPSRLARASGLPVLGSIHEVLTRDQRTERAKKMKIFAGGAAALVGVYALLMVVEFVQRSMVA